MPDTTALVTIWNDRMLGEIDPVQYELLENFRPVWRSVASMSAPASVTSMTNRPMASLFALHLNRGGLLESVVGLQLPTEPRQPLRLSNRQAHAVYRACSGLSITIVRFACSCVGHGELCCLRRSGLQIDLVDAASLFAGPAIMGPRADEPGLRWLKASPGDFPSSPYPGSRARGSWTLTAEGDLHGVTPVRRGMWQDRFTGQNLTIEDRTLVLAYGSNLNPLKLAGLFPGEELHALKAEVNGWAAAWCDARRDNGDVVATLVPALGVEEHAVLAVTGAQLRRMDRWEGHPRYYRREPFTGMVTLADGSRPAVQVYLGTPERRPPLTLDGGHVYLRDQPYAFADLHVRG